MSDLRSLPAVDRLAAALDAPHALAVVAARAVIDERRSEPVSYTHLTLPTTPYV